MMSNRYKMAVIYLLFFLSGSSGLIYEIIWSRKLGLIFGSTVFAVSTILTVFFSGLALGAILIGRSMDRGRNPVSTYVTLEVLLGLFGICSPLIFLGIDGIYYHIQPFVSSSLGGLTTVRFVLSFLGLLIPTTLMGATLPVLVKLVVKADEDVASDAGRLYAVNTLGAALGTILATIVLIPLVGVNASLYIAGSINLLVGAVAYALFRDEEFAPAPAPRLLSERHTPDEKYFIGLFAVVGFISMVYQVAWIRLLIQVTGSTIYTFGLMLSVFIVGVGLGSEISTRFLGRIKSAVLAFALVEIAASAYSLWIVGYFDRLPLLFTSMALEREGFASLLTLKVLINVIVLLFPTLMFGAAFPLVASIFSGKAARSGGDIGIVYSFNTIGGVFGSFIGGFFLLPALGTQATIISMSVAGLVVASLIGMKLQPIGGRAAVAATCLVALLIGAAVHHPWNRQLINSGPYLLQYPNLNTMYEFAGQKTFYYDEGVNVNVSVIGDLKPTTIYINGKPMASTAITDVANQYLLGHIPMLLHPNPRSSVVIGLGAGMTFSALVRHGAPADAIEISPEIVEGTRLFAPYNRSVLDQPNANVIFDDGRNYLRTTRKKYDVITEDPLDPFFMGSGYLYDLEHFENAKRALNPGGIMCQYLPLYQVGLEEARIIIKTFHAVFPHVSAWFAFSDLLLIGSQEPLLIDLENLRRRIEQPAIARDLREVGIDNEYDFLANYLFDQTEIAEIGGDLPLNTDDYPIIEYMTPRALMSGTVHGNLDYALGRRVSEFPGILDLSSLSGGEFAEFTTRMRKYFKARHHLIQAHLLFLKNRQGVLAELSLALEATSPYPTSSHYIAYVNLARGLGLLRDNRFEEALEFLEKANQYRGDHPLTLSELGRALLETGRERRAMSLFERSLELDEVQVVPRLHLADDSMARREFARAIDLLEGCLVVDPKNAECAKKLRRAEHASSSRSASGAATP